MEIQKNSFSDNLGTDWLALDQNGTPIARAADEEAIKRAAPNAVEYVQPSATKTGTFNHDGDGHPGGSMPKTGRAGKTGGETIKTGAVALEDDPVADTPDDPIITIAEKGPRNATPMPPASQTDENPPTPPANAPLRTVARPSAPPAPPVNSPTTPSPTPARKAGHQPVSPRK